MRSSRLAGIFIAPMKSTQGCKVRDILPYMECRRSRLDVVATPGGVPKRLRRGRGQRWWWCASADTMAPAAAAPARGAAPHNMGLASLLMSPGVRTWPALVLPVLTLETLLCVGMVGLAGDAAPVKFDLTTQCANRWVMAGLVLPGILLAAVDYSEQYFTAAVWRWLGEYSSVPCSSTEAPRTERVVSRPLNTYSSHAQVAAGCYVLARAADSRKRNQPLILDRRHVTAPPAPPSCVPACLR